MDKETETQKIPLPDDFEVYLPWAYTQMGGETGLEVIKMMQHEYISIGRAPDRTKAKDQRNKAMPSPTSDDEKSTSWQPEQANVEKFIRIVATYDYAQDLVHIKFDRNNVIPRKVMKIIGLILRFQTRLAGVTINRGLDAHTLHELNTWLPISRITDICLDDTFVEEANYDILLENQCSLRNLSLARCKITDRVVKNIAAKLFYPLPASKSLALLNLSSNRITDIGAMYLSEALRSNRQLYYLNLANNMLSDEGAFRILNTLTEFLLTTEEIMATRSQHMSYLKRKIQLSKRILEDLKAGDFDKKAAKKKSMKLAQSQKKIKGAEREVSANALVGGANRSLLNIEAETMAESMLGIFEGPYISPNTKSVGSLTYCLGNNALCYLNLAYNQLSYLSLKKLLNVVVSQKRLDRNPRGLVNVCVEGNNIPVQCTELSSIDEVLGMGLSKVSVKRKAAARGPK